MDEATRRTLADRIAAYAELLARTGPRAERPFFGVGATALQPTDLQRLAPDLARAADAVLRLRETATRVAESAGRPAPENRDECATLCGLLAAAGNQPVQARTAIGALLAHAGDLRLDEALAAESAWAAARDNAGATFTESAFEIDPVPLRARLAAGVESFWSRLFGPYRGASREIATLLSAPLPKSPADRLRLVNSLINVRSLRKTLAEEEGFLSSLLGPDWRGERTPFAALRAQAAWLARLTGIAPVDTSEALDRICAVADAAAVLAPALDAARAALAALEDRLALVWDGQSLAGIEARIIGMRDGIGRYGDWSRLSALSARLEVDGLAPLLALLDEGAIRPEWAVDEFLYASAEARWEATRAALPDLDWLAHLDRHALVKALPRP
jgi:hypothetical protein